MTDSHNARSGGGALRAGAPFRFRLAERADAPAIVSLVQSAYRGVGGEEGAWTTEEHLVDGPRTDVVAVEAIIGGRDSLMLVAEPAAAGDGAAGGGEPPGRVTLLGCCQLERRSGGAYFGMFAVRPRLQGRGLGRAIVTEAERIARHDLGAAEMRMSVLRQRPELIAWYRRLGYAENGETIPFPPGEGRPEAPKREDLVFEVLVKPLDRGPPGRAGVPRPGD